MSQALAAHFAHDALLPRAPGGMGVGALLALAAHGALLLALTSTVQWRTSPPEVFSAELWSAVPQAAAPLPAATPAPVPAPRPPLPPAPKVEAAPKPMPAPPAPPPAPLQRDADIATEQARRLEAQRKAQEENSAKEAKTKAALEKSKAEVEKAKVKAKADDDKLKAEQQKIDKQKAETKLKRDEAERKAAADAKTQAQAQVDAKVEDDRLARQREENLRRMIGQAGTAEPANPGTGGTGAAAQNSAPSASYVGRLIGLIKPNIVFTGQVDGNPSAEVEVRAAAGGSIISKRLVKSSGNKDWDEAVLRAIDRTATLPSDNGRVPPVLILVFRPKD